MSNVLADDKQHQIVALGRLGWSLRRIERTTGVRRETISGYLKAVGIVVPGRGRRRVSRAKPAISTAAVSTDSGGANPAISEEASTDSGETKPATKTEVSTDSPSLQRPDRAPSASACEPYRALIADALGRGRNAMAIWQDLVDDHGFTARYASVRRFVVTLRGRSSPEARVVITTAPGEEAQVDYGEGPMVRHPDTGKYRRTRLFVLTLGYSRKAVLVWVDNTLTGFAGYTNWIWDGGLNMLSAKTRVTTNAALASRSLMKHELLHALGFHHTCAWTTVMGGYGCASANR